jgi:hypothetical protein
MPPNSADLHTLGARFENRVKLSAVLEDFPSSFETRRNHEAIARTKCPALTGEIFECDSSLRQAAELRFSVADAPFSAGTGPDPGVKLLGRIAEVVGDLVLRISSQQSIGGRGSWLIRAR